QRVEPAPRVRETRCAPLSPTESNRMDEPTPQLTSQPQRSSELAQAIDEQRSRVHRFVAAHREHLDRIESELARQVERVAAELDTDRRRTRQEQQAAQAQSDELRQRADELAELKTQLDRKQAEWQQAQEESSRRQVAL